MPRLPSAQDINRQLPSVDRQIVSLPVDPMGRTMQQAGSALQKTGAQLQRQADRQSVYEERLLAEEKQKLTRTQKAFAQTAFIQDLNDWQAQAMEDTDYATQPQRFNEYAQKALQKYSTGISDEEERTMFELSAKQDISNFGLKLRANAYEVRNKQLLAGMEDNYVRTVNQISASDDVATIQRLAQAQIEQINALEAAGTLPPSQAAERRRNVVSTTAYSQLDKKKPEDILKLFNGEGDADFSTTGNAVLDEAIDTVSAQTNVPKEFLIRTAQIESGGKVNAKNPNSTAAGAFQLLENTAKTLGVNPYDVKQSTMGAAGLYLENKARFENELGRAPTNAEMYLMHQQGAPSAMSLFKAASNGESALDALTRLHDANTARDMIVNNGGNLDMTAEQFVNKWVDKFDGRDDIELLQYISPAQQAQLQNKAIKTIEKQQKAALEQQEQMVIAETVSNAIRGEGYINPKDTKQMKMFDDVYNQQILDNPDISIEEKAIGTAEIVKNVGIMPNSLKGRMQQVFRVSNAPDEIAQYADIVAKVEEESPQVLNDLPSETRIMASYINEGRRAGIDVSDRVASMRSAMLPENAPMVEKRKELLKSDDVKKTINKNVENIFDSWIPFAGQDIDTSIGINQLVANDYKIAFEQSYLMTEDVDAANAYASSVIKTQYAPSMFADGEVMKYAPEMYYSIPNDDGTWMQKYLLDDVNEFYGNQKTHIAEKDAINREIDFIQSKLPTTFNPTEKKLLEEKIASLQKSIPKGTPLTDNQVRIMSDSRTLREARATGKPSYKVIVTTYPNGYPKVEELKARFIPDMQKRLRERQLEQGATDIQNENVRNLRGAAKTGVIQ